MLCCADNECEWRADLLELLLGGQGGGQGHHIVEEMGGGRLVVSGPANAQHPAAQREALEQAQTGGGVLDGAELDKLREGVSIRVCVCDVCVCACVCARERERERERRREQLARHA